MRRMLILIGLAAVLAGPARAGPTAEAEAAFETDDYDRALALYSQAVDQAGANPAARASALFDRAEAYGRHAEDQKALADYGEALQLAADPRFKAVVLTGRADLYAQMRRYPDAIADYTQALALKPDLVGVHTARGQTYSRIRDDTSAMADYEAELKLNPKYPRALRARAVLLGQPDPTQIKEHAW